MVADFAITKSMEKSIFECALLPKNTMYGDQIWMYLQCECSFIEPQICKCKIFGESQSLIMHITHDCSKPVIGIEGVKRCDINIESPTPSKYEK